MPRPSVLVLARTSVTHVVGASGRPNGAAGRTRVEHEVVSQLTAPTRSLPGRGPPAGHVSDEHTTLLLMDTPQTEGGSQGGSAFSQATRGWRLIRGCDSGDPVALSRLDALLVEAQRTAPLDPEVLRLRVAYAERQWAAHRGTVIHRSNAQLLEDLTAAEGMLPDETAVVTLLARVEGFCDDPDGDDRTASLKRLESAASRLLSRTGDPRKAAAAARDFVRLVATVRDGHRALAEAEEGARARGTPEVLVRCLAYARWQAMLTELATDHPEWTKPGGRAAQ